MAEWTKAVALKATVPERVPGVRIPPSPLERNFRRGAGAAERGSLLRSCVLDRAPGVRIPPPPIFFAVVESSPIFIVV